jgi:predicted RecB family nuclease
MQLRDDGTLRLSPSDLSNHLACPHLTTLSLAAARGEIVKPKLESPHRDLIFRKGNEHEETYLTSLVRKGKTVISLPTLDDEHFDRGEARRLTEDAIRAGEAEVIYQPYLTDGTWAGFADFLERQEDGGYEPVDTKLARSAKPSHVLQLLFYAEQLARIQGRPVERVHVENGLGERESFRSAELDAYYRRVRGRFLTALADEPETYGWPVSHCGICDFRLRCRGRRVEDDHLSLVAGMRRAQAETLMDGGVTTLEELGELPGISGNGLLPAGTDLKPYGRVRLQAALQLRGRREGRYLHELLPDEEERGFRLLPVPDHGDVWFDMEGHPFYETSRGLEYLFGYCYRDDDGAVRYAAVWGRDREAERAAFEQFVDWIVERRRRFPGMHVYHYAAYERSALTRLMGEHGTREAEVDDFLRQEVLVDLYRVVKQAIRASTESYSIKEIEKLYGFVRTAEVAGGDESVARFEEWVETGDDSLLEDVERYNEEDCRSTFELHEWLLSIRPPETPWRLPPAERPRSEEAEQLDAEREALKERLLAGAEEGSPRRLLANLVDYHQREQRPEWWAWFRWPQLDDQELVRDRTAIGGLEWESGTPEVDGQSHAYRATFPDQEHKLEHEGWDPESRKGFRIAVDDDNGVVTLYRSTARADEPLPRGLTPGPPIRNWVIRDALLRFVRAYADGDDARYPALTALLEQRPPDVDLDAADPVAAALSLGRSYLFVQGPPGSGKTWQGARMAIALMREGRRVAVTSLSHKAINNMLRAVQHEADQQDFFEFRGVKRGSENDPDEAYTSRCFVTSEDVDVCASPEYDLVAGTAWALTRDTVDVHQPERPIDVLFVDEAGQLSLADVLATGTSARSLVLLGDPNQLPQVSQGTHPEGSGRSALQHLLGDDVTIPPDRGLFLAETWRLRPELCAFTSTAYYEGRLDYAPITETRSLAAGNGPEWLSVAHLHRGQSSVEEADAVADLVDELIDTSFDDEGSTRPLRHEDILVVAPYNAQVRTLRSRLPPEVPVGTVDKFQGQQAPVVVVSMASSTPEDAPRGVGFAFDRHRFNVATSRAQCRAVLVCTPQLLDVDCRTVEQMRLVAAVCRFVELAD